MRSLSSVILLTATTFLSLRVEACGPPPPGNPFDNLAPTATDIIAIQIESLEMDHDDFSPDGYGQLFRGKVRVLRHFRGSGEFTGITYRHNQCSGLRVDIGGIYLIATNSTAAVIDLPSGAAPIIPVTGFFTFDPQLVLRLSGTVEQLEAALRGQRSFELTTPAMREELSTESPPPPIPPPESF